MPQMRTLNISRVFQCIWRIVPIYISEYVLDIDVGDSVLRKMMNRMTEILSLHTLVITSI